MGWWHHWGHLHGLMSPRDVPMGQCHHWGHLHGAMPSLGSSLWVDAIIGVTSMGRCHHWGHLQALMGPSLGPSSGPSPILDAPIGATPPPNLIIPPPPHEPPITPHPPFFQGCSTTNSYPRWISRCFGTTPGLWGCWCSRTPPGASWWSPRGGTPMPNASGSDRSTALRDPPFPPPPTPYPKPPPKTPPQPHPYDDPPPLFFICI